MQAIKDLIRTIPDFPKKGIMFRDITTLLKDPSGLRMTIDALSARYRNCGIETVVGIEARGFILGSAVAYNLGVGFVPVRKKGKLPGEVERYEYELEYGTDMIEIHRDALHKGEKVLLIDDLLATGGTCLAAAKLVEKIGGVVEEIAFVVDLPDVGGRERIIRDGYKIFTLCKFEGD